MQTWYRCPKCSRSYDVESKVGNCICNTLTVGQNIADLFHHGCRRPHSGGWTASYSYDFCEYEDDSWDSMKLDGERHSRLKRAEALLARVQKEGVTAEVFLRILRILHLPCEHQM